MKLSEKVKRLRTEVVVLYYSFRDPRTPWYAKALMGIIVAYALSPVDLIPDFIPIIGYLDDLILIPAGIYLTLKLVPDEVLEEYREKARSEPVDSRIKWIASAIIFTIWLLVLYLIVKAIWL
ncbi:MAG: YkvA family protein [Dehalococcoidia bacterium]|jgi:uncharacterized membrane protein YkvA (DUF1232 family)